MKKSLITLAVLSVSGAAFAQSSVSLYGIADIYVAKVKGASATAGSGGVSPSRWGVKGSEDLGGGFKAVFNFEQGVDLTSGAAAGFTRQANVGFEGGFGAVKIGRSYTALDDMFGAANSGFDSALSANAVWLNGATYTSAANAQLYYATPEVAGFSGAVSTQLTGNALAGKATTFNVKYANGPIYAGLGYEKDDSTARKGTILNGSYDLGMAKLLGSYYTSKIAGAKINSYQIGADIPLSSAMTVSIGYAASKPAVGATSSGYGLAASYSLSKRTAVYAGVRMENATAGDKDIYAVGIKHTF